MLALVLLAVLASGPLAFAAEEPALPTTLDVQDRPFPRLHFARFPGAPFSGALRWDQVIQGQLGSCFFLSALAAVARTHPEVLTKAIRREAGGEYVVTLSSADGKAVAVAVDDYFPATADGKPFFARARDGEDIRPALFEKAYARLLGGYEAINGGEAADAFQALTGEKGTRSLLANLPQDAVLKLLARAAAENRPAAASTPELKELRRATGRDDLDGIIEDHVYAVLGLGG
ncbi:MAG TPA: C2 family cysteine protease, partial [Elusimicrobiota bacterium]|nr:C2 family cysteine protease [Elusimicrobiota bacterium]